MRLGIFGGSFDPVHNGHLELARCCQRVAALDEVWFTPTAVQPLKQHGPRASDAQRLAMLELAIAAEESEPGRPRPRPGWQICKLEIDRGGLSYTVDTLGTIHSERPDDELFFLMGADAVGDVPHWKHPAEIFRLATPLVVHRAGQPPPDLSTLMRLCTPPHIPRLVDMPAAEISSSDIRRRIAAGEPIDAIVPSPVAHYIGRQRPYGGPAN